MTVIISSTYDDLYFPFLPIVSYVWQHSVYDCKIFCLLPKELPKNKEKVDFVLSMLPTNVRIETFDCSPQKTATYSQCSRLYAAAFDFPDDEILVTSDVDMLVFKQPPYKDGMTIWGGDLTPKGQYPMCYASAKASEWRTLMGIGKKTMQQCLDELLGEISSQNMRGDYWSKDQEELYNKTCESAIIVNRAKFNTQFAKFRIDRDDSYFHECINWDAVDYHAHRPLYKKENIEKIHRVISYYFPMGENPNWLFDYAAKYRSFL